MRICASLVVCTAKESTVFATLKWRQLDTIAGPCVAKNRFTVAADVSIVVVSAALAAALSEEREGELSCDAAVNCFMLARSTATSPCLIFVVGATFSPVFNLV